MKGMRVTIDGLDLSPAATITINPGTSAWDAIRQLGGDITIEHVPWEAKERTISVKAAAFIRDYHREDAASALAVYWRYGSLEAEEFDTVEEAERFIEGGEEYGTLAGEAIVAIDGRITVCD